MTELTPSLCKNCGNPVSDNFCSHCGQKTIVERFTVKTSLNHFWSTIFNIDRGLWYTIKMMTVNPKKVFDDYLSGNTIRYMHPFRFAIILLTVQTFLMITTGVYEEIQDSIGNATGQEPNELSAKITTFTQAHTHIIIALTIPFLALGAKWLFRSSHYNFAEHLIIQSFAYGQVVLIGILTLPFQIYMNNLPLEIRFLSVLLSIAYLTYVYISTFRQKVILVLLKTVVVFTIWFIGMMLTTTIIGGVYGAYLYFEDPSLFNK